MRSADIQEQVHEKCDYIRIRAREVLKLHYGSNKAVLQQVVSDKYLDGFNTKICHKTCTI